MVDPVDYSQTQRIVLLIDLQPLLRLQNPSPYLTTIFAAARNLVAFRPLLSCLFAFKFFFSSLSPLLSSSAVHRLVHKPSAAAASLSFDHPSETLSSLSQTLDSLSSSPVSSESATSPPRASHVAGSLLQLVHDYAWESQNENLSGRVSNFPNVRPNLVLLLLPLDCVSNSLSEFINVGVDNELFSNADLFCKNFQNFFGSVSDAYVSRDIHCTWVGVKFIVGDNGDKIETDETLSQLGFLKDGIRSLGWGFCSTDSIILGSALIPFQLIYPMMGISFSCLNCNYSKSFHAQLTLEISDVMGRPLECKCCDLEMLDLKKPSKLKTAEIMHTLDFRNTESEALEQVDRFWEYLGEGVIKIHIRAVQKCKEDIRIESCSSNLILVRGGSGELGRSMKKKLSTFFADRVLEILLSEMGELIHGKTFPIWQILLCFLCRKDYVAVVSLSRGNGNCLTGILKPFTAHSGLLYIVGEDICGNNLIKVDEFLKPYSHNTSTGSVSSQLGILSSLNNESLGDQNRKKNKKVAYQNLTWFSFHKAAFECSALVLEEVYLASKYNDSKKLKFFKCWMKQIEKSNYGCLPVPNESRSCQYVERDIDERLIGAHDESEQPIPSYFCSGSSNIHEGAAFVSCSETSESFFSNLPRKIQDGIESKGVDLQILAERLVNLSIYWLYQKNDADNSLESETPTGKSDTCCGKAVASSIIKLLLKEPKQLKEGPKDADESFPASDPGSTNLTSAETVREHELQILLRMEILRSKVGEGVEASTKRKLVKEICMLLEIIQYLVEGGFHGHLSLYDYVEKTIKIRYSHVLCEVVHKIYRKMDLLPYGDENESLIRLLNSEDSNNSWREKDRYEAATNRIHESTSAENESLQSLEHNQDSPLDVNKEEHARRLTEAQERRERARRFVSFTTWVPDLQRVWAPKQPKAARAKSELSQKQPKRKARHRGNHDVVCETPMMVKNHNGSNPSVSVSKALFQDDR